MLNSAFDLIRLAASNSHAVFCLCNLIIVILLVGCSKSRSEFNEDKHFSHKNVVRNNRGSMERTNASFYLKTVITLSDEYSSVSVSMVDDDEGSRDDEEEEDDDEFRRRAEEFIEKINKGWMDEKLKAYSLGQNGLHIMIKHD
ncbi:uncharacterized protein LOC111406962 [Olea europaea var. sylvestris]|uniref:uncharacterized protein LOC111406962 n=1 Tax=Olea europaea var. sylvestris TaxID=158386 RepID=UPI000C1CE65C|nr:uncharacterized protein LOC111406962 [Olea europaea var. sylvestris]